MAAPTVVEAKSDDDGRNFPATLKEANRNQPAAFKKSPKPLAGFGALRRWLVLRQVVNLEYIDTACSSRVAN